METTSFSETGSFIEGVGDEVVLAFSTFLLIAAVTLIICNLLSPLVMIHPDNIPYVDAARASMGVPQGGRDHDDEYQQLRREDGNNRNNNGTQRTEAEQRRRYYSDRSCPICLREFCLFAVETNCGHLYCGECIIAYWRHGNWFGAINCPVCRQQVTLLLRDYNLNHEETREINREVLEYNRRFSGEPRPWLDYVRDVPALLRHLWREFFSANGLALVFRVRIVLIFLLVILYILSPLDVIPEAVLGLVGLFDDLFVFFMFCIYISILYRHFLTHGD